MSKTSKAAPEKKEVVKKILQFGKQYPIIGLLNMENMPASSLLVMKKQLRGKVELVMTRKTLILLGLKDLKLPGGERLIEQIKGMPALMFTKENPFALYKIIKKSKTPAAAKAGQLAPRDIIIPAGPTPFTPGPIISEFAALGIKAGVEGGKVAVKQDAMEIGLDLICAYEKGIIYQRTVLDIDETKFMQDLIGAASGAFNLAIEATHITKDTIETLLGKAHREAKAVGIEGNIMEPEIVGEILAKAQRQAQSVASEGNIQVQ
ncbi:MAG: 50S ribosomal protein L10 [Candidatus Woesearchaeota archaeon]|nr:50S ribosomal protein L10 [Candidatus Woesearchaeota archaeon]